MHSDSPRSEAADEPTASFRSSRRALLTKGAVGGAALWIAPAILSSQPAGAWGSCAASMPGFPTTNATTNSNGWTRVASPYTGFSQAFWEIDSASDFVSATFGDLGIYRQNYGTNYLDKLVSPSFLSEADPRQASAVLTYSAAVSVQAGYHYRFRFQSLCTAINPWTQNLDILVGGVARTVTRVAGSQTYGPASSTLGLTTSATGSFGASRVVIPNGRPTAANPTNSNGTNQDPNTYEVVYVAPSTAAVQFQFRFTFEHAQVSPGSSQALRTANASDDIAVTAPTVECSLTGF